MASFIIILYRNKRATENVLFQDYKVQPTHPRLRWVYDIQQLFGHPRGVLCCDLTWCGQSFSSARDARLTSFAESRDVKWVEPRELASLLPEPK